MPVTTINRIVRFYEQYCSNSIKTPIYHFGCLQKNTPKIHFIWLFRHITGLKTTGFNVADINFKEQLEKKIAKDLASKFGNGMSVTITLKGKRTFRRPTFFTSKRCRKAIRPNRKFPACYPLTGNTSK